MVPTVYVEGSGPCSADCSEVSLNRSVVGFENVYAEIAAKNRDLIERTERGEVIDRKEYKEMVFHVGKLDIELMNGSHTTVYDIPGLNDARTKNVYYDYLRENFVKFNLIVFIVDINSGMNTSDEIEIANFVATSIRDQKVTHGRIIHTLVVVNKADDMRIRGSGDSCDGALEFPNDDLELTGELNEMFEQVVATITGQFSKHSISEHLVGIVPLCAADAYLYRMVRKHGERFKLSPQQILKICVNESGKKCSTLGASEQEKIALTVLKDRTFIDTMIRLSGFQRFERTLREFLNCDDRCNNIRIENILRTLKGENLPYLLGQIYTKCRGGGRHCEKLYSDEYRDIVTRYYDVYDKIETINSELRKQKMQEFTNLFVEHVKAVVCKFDNIDILLNDYGLIRSLLRPEYCDLDEWPDFVVERVFQIIEKMVCSKDSYLNKVHLCTVTSWLSSFFDYLKRLNRFNLDSVSRILNQIIESVEITVVDDKTIPALCNLLKTIPGHSEAAMQFCRFVLLHDIQLHSRRSIPDCDYLYLKKLFYLENGELAISTAITVGTVGSHCPHPSIQCVTTGKMGKQSHGNLNEMHELEMYYLELYHR
jgi:hypothetical protein